MALVGRAVEATVFDETQIDDMRKANLIELPCGVFRVIYESLDICSTWREMVAMADGSRYSVSALDVERFASVIHHDLTASPAKRLLDYWGHRCSMTAETLTYYLDKLRLEEPLKYLRLPEELSITLQPASTVTGVEGSELVLTCEAAGFPYPRYEWFKERKQINTGISNTGRLVISKVSANSAGLYTCRIHHVNHIDNKKYAVFTDWCLVEFEPRPQGPSLSTAAAAAAGGCTSLPVITQHPVSQTLRQNDLLVLSCLAQSSSPLQYHWVKNGSLLAVGSQLQVALVDDTDTGEYFCIVKNEFGEIRSHSAVIVVSTDRCIQAPLKPQFLRQPVDLSVGIGGDAIFVVEAEFLTKLSYQWFHNGESIPNATGPELRFPVEDSLCSGKYQCVVSSGLNQQSVLSHPATLAVTSGNPVYKAADKLALLIGVSTYMSHGVPLPAVKNDFEETVKVLEEMQFKVVSLLDLTLHEMQHAIDIFCELLSPDVYTIFYCAGHGFIHNNGSHYLIPWDARLDVNPAECICIEAVEKKIQEKRPKLLMFCLDICRKKIQTNTRVESAPVQRLSSSPSSVPNRIVLYAASEGQQAFEQGLKSTNKPRGLFNQYLLEVIHKRMRAADLHYALIEKFKHSPYRTSPYYRDSFQQNPEMKTNLEDHERSLHDPLDTKCFHDTINKQTVLWHQVHRLPYPSEIPISSKLGKVAINFTRVTSNMMEMHVTLALLDTWHFTVHIANDSIQSALRPVHRRVSGSCTTFRLENLQRLRENLQIRLCFQVTTGKSSCQFSVELNLGRPLIAYAFSCKAATFQSEVGQQTERKEAMEHTEDHSLSSEA